MSCGYDAAGNVTYDLINNYLYDPEGRLCAVLIPRKHASTISGEDKGNRYQCVGDRFEKLHQK
jgi:hypothetical protein